jgi:hypothetical protein
MSYLCLSKVLYRWNVFWLTRRCNTACVNALPDYLPNLEKTIGTLERKEPNCTAFVYKVPRLSLLKTPSERLFPGIAHRLPKPIYIYKSVSELYGQMLYISGLI